MLCGTHTLTQKSPGHWSQLQEESRLLTEGGVPVLLEQASQGSASRGSCDRPPDVRTHEEKRGRIHSTQLLVSVAQAGWRSLVTAQLLTLGLASASSSQCPPVISISFHHVALFCSLSQLELDHPQTRKRAAPGHGGQTQEPRPPGNLKLGGTGRGSGRETFVDGSQDMWHRLVSARTPV